MKLLDKKVLSEGVFTQVACSYKDLAYDVFAINAKYVALAHNHPSGSPIPSTDDITMTSKISQMLQQIDAILIEHFLIADDKYIGILKLTGKLDLSFTTI